MASHHLFYVTEKKTAAYFKAGDAPSLFAEATNLSQDVLTRRYPDYALGCVFDGALSASVCVEEVQDRFRQYETLIDHLRRAQDIPLHLVRRLFVSVLSTGSESALRFIQQHMPIFAPAMTPQYRLLIPRVKCRKQPQDALIFHGCQPDLYLWTPDSLTQGTSALICFLTSSNTLNAPLPLAHSILADLKLPILYVYNRKGIDSAKGIAELNINETAAMIKVVLQRLGIRETFLVGASLGGYAGCCFFEKVGAKRMLNFSGAPKGGFVEEEAQVRARDDLNQAMSSSSRANMMLVISATDPTDRKIGQIYDSIQFHTPRTFLATPTHGSFTGAWLEGKLPALFTWLLGSPSLTSQKAP